MQLKAVNNLTAVFFMSMSSYISRAVAIYQLSLILQHDRLVGFGKKWPHLKPQKEFSGGNMHERYSTRR